MKLEEVAKLSPIDRLCYWVRERHQIYLKKLCGDPPPWTDDPILQDYWFTNPYREHDKVTKWFRENIREPLRDDPAVLFATICFRWFNRPTTGKVLIERDLLCHWDADFAIEALQEQSKSGPVFTGAFVIPNSNSTKPKINYICEDVLPKAWERCGPDGDIRNQLTDAPNRNRMEQTHKLLGSLPGFGGHGFMAYEVVCDLRYTYLLENAPDKCTWSNPGPGAKRGMNRVMGRPPTSTCKDYPQRSLEVLQYLRRKLPKMPPFEMREVEHICCEFDKWERARSGDTTMKMKRRYNGRG
jgi:hypothetical protein